MTARMVLRPLTPGDRAAYLRYREFSADHLRPWTPRTSEGVTSDQFFDVQLERSERGLREGTLVRMVALDALPEKIGLNQGTIIGAFNINNIVRGVFQCADAGWQVGAPFIGRGYATEGVRAMLGYAFAQPRAGGVGGLGLHRVQSNVMPHNLRSLRVAEKCAMRREGLGVKMLKIDGEWRDHVMLAKLAEEHQPIEASQ